MATQTGGRLVGKVVFITGAAQGIGRATALVSKVTSLLNFRRDCCESLSGVASTSAFALTAAPQFLAN